MYDYLRGRLAAVASEEGGVAANAAMIVGAFVAIGLVVVVAIRNAGGTAITDLSVARSNLDAGNRTTGVGAA